MHDSSRFRCLTTARARAASRARRAALAVALVVLPAAPAACGRDTITDGVTDSAFVATMAELERVDRMPGLDSSARVAARTAALQAKGLTRAQLEAAATKLAEDPERALAVYRAIEARASGDTSVAHPDEPRLPGGPGRKPATAPPLRRR